MALIPVFMSVICVLRNQAGLQDRLINKVSTSLAGMVADYELLVIDNASTDDSVSGLKRLAHSGEVPNLQVYALTKEVDLSAASMVGLENAVGDYVLLINPLLDDIDFVPQMLHQALAGMDVVFATNTQKPVEGFAYQAAAGAFNRVYTAFNGIDLNRDAPHFRLLSQRVVNFILQHPQPAMTYRHLPASGGFARIRLTYSAPPAVTHQQHVQGSFDRAMRLLVSTTRGPMRLVTSLTLFGAFANVVYSIYVVAVGLFKTNVAPGWVSLSLQQSGLFFLISLVLMVLGEYILNMVSNSSTGPLYHVGEAFTSARLTRREKLNIEEVSDSKPVGV